MTDRRTFIAGTVGAGIAAWAVPEILTMHPADAATLHSPPPKPAHETPPAETTGGGGSGPGGTLAFTGAPIDQETALAAAVIGAGLIVRWVAK